MVRVLVLLALGMPLAHAETYKWVDAKGVVNYSNTPPPGGTVANDVQKVPERISNYTPDPSITNAIDVNRRLDAAQTEWLQRQWLMAMRQAQPPAPTPDYASTYYPTVVFFGARRHNFVHPVFFAPTPMQARAQPRPVRPARLSNRF